MSAQVVQMLGVFCCIAIALAVLPGVYAGELFAWHPLFMTLGFLGFMTEGILTAVRFRPNEGMARVVAISNHGLIQAGSAGCVGIGFYAIFRSKVLKHKLHFTSLHGKCGLIATMLTGLSILLGVGSYRRLGIITKFPESWQPHIKWLHRILAVFAWVLGLVVMQQDLPHPAVFEGLVCRCWQAAVAAAAVMMLVVLRGKWVGKSPLPTSGQQGPKHL